MQQSGDGFSRAVLGGLGLLGGVSPLLAQETWTGQGLEIILVPCCSFTFLLVGAFIGMVVAFFARALRYGPPVVAGAVGAAIGGWTGLLEFRSASWDAQSAAIFLGAILGGFIPSALVARRETQLGQNSGRPCAPSSATLPPCAGAASKSPPAVNNKTAGLVRRIERIPFLTAQLGHLREAWRETLRRLRKS
jgi:hypothetical protein